MYENMWSPFDPEWYQEAFDRFISTADMIFNQQEILNAGYQLPDADGSRSSVFRNEAVLNNSFNEKVLKDTLEEIYLNSTHHLKASNHDNVHFFRWEGNMDDVKLIELTKLCEIRLPWNMFIYQKDRDAFKISQFYRKWIKVEDILKNGSLFKWHLLVFINQKVFSEYEIYIDEQEIILRFPYIDYWVKNNFPIYLYKFDTNFQDRVRISTELMTKQWNWKVPIDYIGSGIDNHSKVMVAFNRLTDSEYRSDGQTRINILGENLEFLDVRDGYVDLTTISQKNRIYIQSELKEWVWMSIFVPKFFHEYPILLPVDTVHRPYQPDIYPVMTLQGVNTQSVKIYHDDINEEDVKQLYIDMKGNILEEHFGWHQMIRPVVLSDAYDDPEIEPYDSLFEEFRSIRDASVKMAEVLEDFTFYCKYESIMDTDWERKVNGLMESMESMYDSYNSFYTKRRAGLDRIFVSLFDLNFKPIINDLLTEGVESHWIESDNEYEETIFTITSKLINIVKELVDRYYTIEILRGMRTRHLWNDPKEFVGKVRFQRPIDESDFWLFEYNVDDKTWIPVPHVTVTHQFPDVYIFNKGKKIESNKIYKAFIFYSDTMNVQDESREIKPPTPDWDEDIVNFHYEQGAIYRDIFMEKFYWMGIRTIYKGMMMSECRWELLEYIIDNDSYQRFNDLFLQTIDPYFKLGLATYLKSTNFEFPFDDTIAKFQEINNMNWNDFKRVTAFETYLNKQWIPSYFDYIIKIFDKWDGSDRYIRRPPASFDILRLLPVLKKVQQQLVNITKEVLDDLNWIIGQLRLEDYNLNLFEIERLKNSIETLLTNMERLLKYIDELDLEIYSIKDLQYIIAQIMLYSELSEEIKNIIDFIHIDVNENNVYEEKRGELVRAQNIINGLNDQLDILLNLTNNLDIHLFMKTVNDLRSYLDHAKTNPDDISIIGQLNEFNDPWSTNVKEMRKNFFKSTALLNSLYDPNKFYSDDEINEFIDILKEVNSDLITLRAATEDFWTQHELEKSQDLIDRYDNGITMIDLFLQSILKYFELRNRLKETVDEVRSILSSLDRLSICDTEKGFRDNTNKDFDKMMNSVSYIVGVNQREDVEQALSTLKEHLNEWFSFVDHEEQVFLRILKVVHSDSEFLIVSNDSWIWLKGIIQYISSMIEHFEPDEKWPTYAEVFEITKIEIFNGGFRHKVGDSVYIQQLGSYRVTSVIDDISTIELVESDERRRTTFRDPAGQLRPYDSITDGDGIGFMVKAVESTRIPIINDMVILPYIIRIEKTLERISFFIDTINPYNNREFNLVLPSITKLLEDWNNLLSRYTEYMRNETRISMTKIITTLQKIIIPSKNFIGEREKINLTNLLRDWDRIIIDISRYANEIGWNDEEFHYYDGEIRAQYYELVGFVGTGTSWDNTNRLIELIMESHDILWSYNKNILPRFDNNDPRVIIFKNDIERLEKFLINIKTDISTIDFYIDPIRNKIDEVKSLINELNPETLSKDLWFTINHVHVALAGEGYAVGDIVALVPELPTDQNGSNYWEVSQFLFERDIFSSEGGVNNAKIQIKLADDCTIMNDDILVRVLRVDEEGRVIDVEMFMNYALPYLITGIRETITLVGNGTGLLLDIFGEELTLQHNTILNSKEIFIKDTHQYDENDLFTFTFQNIHDLDMKYEVFIGGRQVRHFIQRHQEYYDRDEQVLHPRKVDVIYLRANDVMDLAGSSIFFPSENYFIYRINKIDIIDPGAGYAVGQEIFVDTGGFALRLKVASLLYEPFKGLDSFEIVDGVMSFIDGDPSIKGGVVSVDSFNNIDDEYNVGYYDTLPKEGIVKAATLSYPIEEYSFTSKRFDKMDGDDRNRRFIYPFIKKREDDPNGDPSYYWYAGNRIDNSEDPRSSFGGEWVVTKFNPVINDNINKINWRIKSFIPDQSVINYQGGDINFNVDLEAVEHEATGEKIDASVLSSIGGIIDFDIGIKYQLISSEHPDYKGIWDRWNGIYELQPPTDPFIPTSLRLPPDLPPQGEYQRFEWIRFHNTTPEDTNEYIDFNFETKVSQSSNNEIGVHIPISPGREVLINYDIMVETYADLPKHAKEWPDASIGKYVLVENDETNNGHRMLYRLRTFVATGYFVYNWPILADEEFSHIDVDWMNIDWYPDSPQLSQLYPTAPWRESKSFRQIEEEITDGKHNIVNPPRIVNRTSYIHNITVDDLSVFNWTTKEWENLKDDTKWRLTIKNDPDKKEWGFRLTCLKKEKYSHDLRLYWNKISSTQMRNAGLKREAILDIYSTITDEVCTEARNIPVNTLRHIRIRKLFPYEQKQSFIIGYDEEKNPLGYEMDFKLANYMHFKNQLQLQDVKIYNKTAGRFEDILDRKLFEVRFKDPNATVRGFETQTRIIQSIIANTGEGFIDGPVWGWNANMGIHIFGNVTATIGLGQILTFIPLHCPNPPNEDISISFQIFQKESQSMMHAGSVLVEFKTERIEVYGDGYIHNVINPMAPLPKEFKLIAQYNLDGPYEYDIIISKTAYKYTFIDPRWILTPTIKIPNKSISHNNIYLMTEKGRFPLVNPSTNIPSFYTRQTDEGTEVIFLNLYRRYEHLEVRTVPYAMRSVYVQRRIPQHGFIDLAGKLNKPLNKKYFEFWMNGRLLHDEVTIISPTKLVLHGLRSLRNFEIIEINRDPNEYFSDIFLEQSLNKIHRPIQSWNYNTYLDAALDGTLEGDNYSSDEQKTLLSPVWPQVSEDHPSYKDYPPNMDIDDDIILRVHIPNDLPIYDLDDTSAQFMLIDIPSIEGHPFTGNVNFDQFGFRPIDDEMIIDLLNEEWKEEIASNSYLQPHVVISDDEWYGTTARLYDEYGIRVHNLNEAAYKVPDWNLLHINSKRKSSSIILQPQSYDLT